MAESTVLTKVKIDVNPDGITFSIEGLDTDLARLIEAAGTFNVKPVEYHTFDSSNVTIQSDRALLFVPRAPKITTVSVVQGLDVDLTFATDVKWQDAISKVVVDGTELASGNYTVINGKLTILSSAFPTAGQHTIVIKAIGYVDAVVTQTIVGTAP
ncbi:hypothetical protein D1872_51870 [compost metagenome]